MRVMAAAPSSRVTMAAATGRCVTAVLTVQSFDRALLRAARTRWLMGAMAAATAHQMINLLATQSFGGPQRASSLATTYFGAITQLLATVQCQRECLDGTQGSSNLRLARAALKRAARDTRRSRQLKHALRRMESKQHSLLQQSYT